MKSKIFLCGFMGSGKTTVGQLLAKELGYAFADTDHMIMKNLSSTITDIFLRHGEAFFREQERQVIRQLILQPDPVVVALGGGAVIYQSNLDDVLNSGLLIYLQCDWPVIKERLKNTKERPLFDPKTSEKEWQRRQNFYKFAAMTVDVSHKTPQQIAVEIMALINP